MDKNIFKIEDIVVYGHSCAIDFEYFIYLNIRYLKTHWKFYTRGTKSKNNINHMINKYNIINYSTIEEI